VIIDYTKEMVILAVLKKGEKEEVIGMGQYGIDEATHTAEVAFAIRMNIRIRASGRRSWLI